MYFQPKLRCLWFLAHISRLLQREILVLLFYDCLLIFSSPFFISGIRVRWKNWKEANQNVAPCQFTFYTLLYFWDLQDSHAIIQMLAAALVKFEKGEDSMLQEAKSQVSFAWGGYIDIRHLISSVADPAVSRRFGSGSHSPVWCGSRILPILTVTTSLVLALASYFPVVGVCLFVRSVIKITKEILWWTLIGRIRIRFVGNIAEPDPKK